MNSTNTIQPVSTHRLFSAFHICMILLLSSLMVSIAVAQILVGILFILWIMLMMRGVRYHRTNLDIPILIYICARLFSIFFSEYRSLSYIAITRELIFYVSFFFTVFYLQHVEKKKIYSLLKILFVSTVIVSCISITQFILGYTDRVNTLGGGGMLSTHFAFIIPVLLIVKNNKNVFSKPTLFWATLFIFIIGLMFSMTRGDWLAAGVSTIIYGLMFNRKLVLGVLAFVVLLILILPSVQQRLSTLQHPLENTTDRLTLWKNAFTVISVHPVLGFGPESFHKIFNDIEHMGDKNVDAWHNDFLQLYMESGLIGVVSLVLVIVMLFILSIKLIRTVGDSEKEFNVGWMGVLLLIAYLICGIFTMPTMSITNGMLFRFLIAIVAVEHQRFLDKPAVLSND